ncbi:Transcription factor bHLH121 like [Actinidia chinensis var. chinensis]|uniref:Transcription factor bHLH121 like n=1 Tax=Actinidia chinensis var. chinensis TaxID=1590841 RepID=A0A2R6RBS1_ACTCC|nr:Transcription factor bHLH121 like [Actinidia chinensis var. chinensis]
MDHLNHDAFCRSIHVSNPSATAFHQPRPVPIPVPVRLQPDTRPEAELKNGATTRKVQKADREKLRRDRLNDQFLELGKVLDPDRPKNDKASILTDTIQIVKDLTAQVSRLKAEYASLTEESRELTQEKNDLREEKASLKSDIENLNAQYQQRLRATFPWATMDPSVMMHPPSYPMPMPMPMPVPIPTGPIPMHPSLQPYPFFGNQNHVIPNPCSTFVPYVPPNAMIDQQSTQYMSLAMQPGSSKQDSRNKASDRQGESKIGKNEASNDVATDLELKTPGSTADEDSSFGQRKSKKLPRKESSLTDGSSSRCSSSPSIEDSSLNSVVDGGKADD